MSRAGLALRAVGEAWRAVTWRHVRLTAAFAFASSAVTVATATSYFTDPFVIMPSINAVLSMQLNGFAVLFAVLIADRAVAATQRRVWPYAIAVVAGVAVGTSAMWLVSQRFVHIGTMYSKAGYEAFATFGFRHGSHALIVCGLVAFVYVSARWSAQRREALRKLQLERAAKEKELVDSTLAATRARVDPTALQATLARIDSLYDTSPGQADALLGTLIAELRAAIPRHAAAAGGPG
jgi:hypothetical protein